MGELPICPFDFAQGKDCRFPIEEEEEETARETPANARRSGGDAKGEKRRQKAKVKGQKAKVKSDEFRQDRLSSIQHPASGI